jgi:hypothetical protein
LIDFVPGGPPRTPSTFVLHLAPLIERIAAVRAATDDYLGLADSEISLPRGRSAFRALLQALPRRD